MALNSTISSDALYRKEAKVYPRDVQGRYATLRRLAMIVLLGLFYILPWINWAGRQAVLFDLPARKFYIFGLTLWPQDFIYLALLLVIAGLSLFFFTALAGRLWCGYACPQTVWTEAFLLIERWVEGDRNKRIKLDKAPLNRQKLVRKSLKHGLWILFALFTGLTFVGYFTPIRELAVKFYQLQAGPWETFWSLFYGFATYGNAGFLREQVCKYMCPYARFQSAMFDRDTLVIAYDDGRGEPRGGRSRKADPKALGLGDCIDCTLCVQVCPTGIDIRNGLQYECIACAACIDVCDQVMKKVGYQPGLVRYTTERRSAGKDARILRPRMIVYALLLVSLLTVLLSSIATRQPLRAELIRDRNALYRVLDSGSIENVYSLRLINMDNIPHQYRLEVGGLLQAAVDIDKMITLPAERDGTFTVRIRAPQQTTYGGQDIQLTVSAADYPDQTTVLNSRFFFPPPRR